LCCDAFFFMSLQFLHHHFVSTQQTTSCFGIIASTFLRLFSLDMTKRMSHLIAYAARNTIL
jgi:hypothetical protein